MSYCTTTSLETLMIGTTFDTLTTNLATKAITYARNEVDKWCAMRFDVSGWTYGTNPPITTDWCEKLAVGFMYKAMSRGSKDALKRAASFIDPVMENLKGVVEHKQELLDSTGSALTDSSTGTHYMKSTTEDYHQVFNLDDPLNWSVDQDQLDDISDDRG